MNDKIKDIEIPPIITELSTIQDYINKIVKPLNIDSIYIQKLYIVIDELFSNIVNYSTATKVYFSCEIKNNQINLTFKDDGISFNPLDTQTPDLSKEGHKNRRGGLGINHTLLFCLGIFKSLIKYRSFGARKSEFFLSLDD